MCQVTQTSVFAPATTVDGKKTLANQCIGSFTVLYIPDGEELQPSIFLMENILHQPIYVPGSKLLILGRVISPLIGNPYNGIYKTLLLG